MDTKSFQSPLGSESQDEWGSGIWMDEAAPHAQEEDVQLISLEQQQTNPVNLSGDMAEDFLSSSAARDVEIALNSGLTGMNNATGGQEWPPLPPQADQPVQMVMDLHSESPEGSDSLTFLSEDSEENGIDCKPLNFISAKEQWVRRDSSSSKPPTPAFSRSSSRSLITEQCPVHTDTPDILQGQQEEPKTQNPSPYNDNQEVQQVCTPAPPLETVASEQAANPDPGSPTCSAIVVKEPFTESAGGWREGERESEQTDTERKQTVSCSDTEETRRKSKPEDLEEETRTLTSVDAQRTRRMNRMDLDQFDDCQSDSGVSADFSPNSTAEILSTSVAPSTSPDSNETPIEREIRLAIKREQSLRRSRGLEATEDKATEFVEIPMRKSILAQELPLKSVRNEGKDRQFAGKKMQREIRAEVEREKVLVQLGRLPGFYDKGTVRQLREKKLLFEAFQEPKETFDILNKRPSCDISNGGTQVDGTAGFCKERKQSFELLVQDSNGNHKKANLDGGLPSPSNGACGPRLTEGSKGQVIILENTPSAVAHIPVHTDKLTNKSTAVVDGSGSGRSFSVKPYAGQVQNQDANYDEESAMLKENPFFKLRSSLSLRPDVQQDIQEAREREKELRKQRTSIYGPGPEVSAIPPATQNSTSPEQPRISIRSSITPVRQSLGKLDKSWPPAPQEESKVQSEVQKRQRSVLLQRWENGLLNGHLDQQE